MKKIMIGIDPGKNGAISVIDVETLEVIDVIDMPVRYFMPRKTRKKQSKYLSDGKTLRKKRPPLKQDARVVFNGAELNNYFDSLSAEITIAAIELVSSRTGQGVASSFKFGDMFGSIKGYLEAKGINYVLIRPQTWQSFFNIEKSADDNAHKMNIAAKALEIYPEVNIYGPKGGLKDGRSDAVLIGRYWLENEGRGEHVGMPPWEISINA